MDQDDSSNHSQLSDQDHQKRRPHSETKRIQQNRAAQRAFRQRKEQYVRDLESKVRDVNKWKNRVEQLERENMQLRRQLWMSQGDISAGYTTKPPQLSRRTSLENDEKIWPTNHSPLTISCSTRAPKLKSQQEDNLETEEHIGEKSFVPPDDPFFPLGENPCSFSLAEPKEDDNEVLDDLIVLLRNRYRPPIAFQAMPMPSQHI
ncbi:hypothetical protein CLU79DRAFT_311417 [Phycomyces nitens]|nr:hypothetical protein CLU79DRAFT_311417 [Phycomyces nitens]